MASFNCRSNSTNNSSEVYYTRAGSVVRSSINCSRKRSPNTRFCFLFLVITISVNWADGKPSIHVPNNAFKNIYAQELDYYSGLSQTAFRPLMLRGPELAQHPNVVGPKTDPVGFGGGQKEEESGPQTNLNKSRQVKQEGTEAPATTTQAPATTGAPATTTTSPPTTNGTTQAPTTNTTTTTLAPDVVPNVNISSINYKNYSLVDHTSFNDGMHDWDFQGIWSKTDLSKDNSTGVPMPRPAAANETIRIEGGGNPGGAVSGLGGAGALGGGSDTSQPSTGTMNATYIRPQDQNNYVVINYASSLPATLLRNYSSLTWGEVILSYYAATSNANFSLVLVNANNTRHVLYDSTSPTANAITKAWTARSFNFTANQTLSREFTLLLSVSPPPNTFNDALVPVLAVHHIAVGGMLAPQPPTTTTPAPPNNATIFPPGSLNEIKKISWAIWTALYVFLAFFLLCIVALVALVVRGRRRQGSPKSSDNDYNPDTTYRLDKVYDNPSYDASSP